MAKNYARKAIQQMNPAFGHHGRTIDPKRIRLCDNENPFGGKYNRYPDDGTHELAACYLQLLDVLDDSASFLVDDQGNDGIDHLLITRGASDALDLVFRAFFEPGTGAIAVTPPNFRLFNELAITYNIAVHETKLTGPRFDRLDVSSLSNSPVQGILLCDPNNPLGTSIHANDINFLLKNYSGLIVIDEAYVEYSTRQSYRFLIHKHPNLLVVRSMSKALGVAGLRLGAVIARPELINAMQKVRLPFALPSIVIDAAIRELSNTQSISYRVNAFKNERDRFAHELQGCTGVEQIFSSAGFITIKAVKNVYEKLHRAGFDVVTDPMNLTGYVRISLENTDINNQLIDTLKQS